MSLLAVGVIVRSRCHCEKQVSLLAVGAIGENPENHSRPTSNSCIDRKASQGLIHIGILLVSGMIDIPTGLDSEHGPQGVLIIHNQIKHSRFYLNCQLES